MKSGQGILASGTTLTLIAAICTALVAATYQLTAERISANQQTFLEQSFEPALSGLFYDGSITESKLVIPASHELPGSDAAVVYRAYAEDRPVAALFIVTARDGYSGPIRLLIGINADGVVTAVRVLEHRETPGLGDRIDISRSDWVLQFDGRSMIDPDIDDWAIKRDGGEFDQLTGASVTPRAVIKAISETLVYFDAHRDEIFALPATEEDQ
jgi:electron transport complex protein RnfG